MTNTKSKEVFVHEAKQHMAAMEQRVPTVLQAVFLGSNRGHQINKPPPQRAAARVFGARPSKKSFFDVNSLKTPNTPFKLPEKRYKEKKCQKNSNKNGLSLADPKRRFLKPVGFQGESPQHYLEKLLTERGYSIQTYPALETAYYNSAPTPLQKASHQRFLAHVVRAGDAQTLGDLLTCGLSPNPCTLNDSAGSSLVHLACRLGVSACLETFLSFGAVLRADSSGRTPMHEACWTLSTLDMDVVDLLLRTDKSLLALQDKRGVTPLTYVPPVHWGVWKEYLDTVADEFWPVRTHLPTPEVPARLLSLPPDSRPVRDPERALSPRDAVLVAAGHLEVEEARFLISKGQDDNGAPGLHYGEVDNNSESASESTFSDSEMESLIESLPATSANLPKQ